jgi:uncharacterized membrane protein
MDSVKTQNISDKEWLDLAFKYFIQHAQQRVQHFNYFIIYSSLLTTGAITCLQPNIKAYSLGIGIGLIQLFVSFVFNKLDDRNRFLIKHAENIIKNIEKQTIGTNHNFYPLFTLEENLTNKLAQLKKKNIISRPISHKTAYSSIYLVFGIIGFIYFIISVFSLMN